MARAGKLEKSQLKYYTDKVCNYILRSVAKVSLKKVLLTALLVLSVALVGCGSDKAAKQDKVLKVATSPDFAPFAFTEEKSKEYVGFEMDLIKAIAKQMGTKAEISNISFDGLIPALLANNVDLAISGVTITPERQQKVDFSQAYYRSGLSIMVRTENNEIKSFKDLAGKKVAVQIGTSSATAAKNIPNATVREFNLVPEVVMELQNKGVDAVINDLPVNQYFLATTKTKDVKLVGELLSTEDYGIMVNKGNKKLLEQINKAMDELKKNGEYDKIYKKWFGELKK